jgi:hypothetical protein
MDFHITQNNTTHSNKAQRTKLHKETYYTIVIQHTKSKDVPVTGRGGL